MRAFLALALVGVVLAGCDSRAALKDLARDTCAELRGAIVLQVGSILGRAISEAEDLNFSAADLGDEMRAQCPDVMAAITDLQTKQSDREALPGKMVVKVTSCSQKGANGTVRNESAVTADIFIDAHFLDSGGTIIDDGIDSVSAVRPGETALWEAHYLGTKHIDSCRAEVGSAYAK